MPWRLIFERRAARQMRQIPKTQRDAIQRAIDQMVADPSSVNLRKLEGRGNEWRLRVGHWSVILELDNGAGLMTVLQVLPRDRAYRD